MCSICSHEGYITLDLNKEQKEQFCALGIPYYLDESEEKSPVFPFLKETVPVFSTSGVIATLLGQGPYDFNEDATDEYLEFYQWFEEHEDNMRKEIIPCRKSVKEILAYLQQHYSMEPYYSEIIKLQCERHGWDDFFAKPKNADSKVREGKYFKNEWGKLEGFTPNLAPFLYRLNYQGEELIVGGEYNSGYLFADVPGIEQNLKNLVESLEGRERICGITGQASAPETLISLLKEINVVRGIDEYEKYDNFHSRTYIQILKYDDYKKTC